MAGATCSDFDFALQEELCQSEIANVLNCFSTSARVVLSSVRFKIVAI